MFIFLIQGGPPKKRNDILPVMEVYKIGISGWGISGWGIGLNILI